MLTFDRGVADLAPIAITIPILGACALLVLGKRLPRLLIDGIGLAVTAGVVAILSVLLVASSGGRAVTWSGNWVPHRGYSVGIVLVGDPVGAGLALLAASLMLLALLFSVRYFDSIEAHYHCLMLVFLAGMIGLALTGDLFDMFCFFELMGAAAYGLTGIKVEDESALQGALNFGIINSLGAYLTLMGIGLLFARTGNLGLAQLGQDLSHHHPDALTVAGLVLVLTGFLVKAAVVPFHFWLADAHAVAPAPVSVLFSGVMVPLGVYCVFRIYTVVFVGTVPAGDIRRTFIVLGAVTALVGAVMAFSQRHVKRLLAFSTIAHVGLFLVALGCLTEAGSAGAVVYIVAHAGIKSGLFLIAGLMLDLFGHVDELRLYGMGRGHKAIGWLFLFGGLALAGLPPTGTGLGKAISEEAGGAAGYWWIPVLFVVVSAMTGGAVLRVGARVFFGLGPRPDPQPDKLRASGEKEHREVTLRKVPATMMVPIVVLMAGGFAVGVLPGCRTAAGRAAAFFLDGPGYAAQALYRQHVVTPSTAANNWTGVGIGLGFVSVAGALAIAAVGLYRGSLSKRWPPLRLLSGPVTILHRLHSGHIGDYVAWLIMGMAILAAFVGLPLR